ncbi:MAG: D-alanyl-lipoteichoic acid biosynthesis protein DltD [Clostridium neonatale]
MLNSREFEDFEFLLSVCKDLNIKPYIILMNVNGWYYDGTE